MKSNEIGDFRSWRPNLNAIGDNTEIFFDPYTSTNQKIVWKLKELPLQGLPMTFAKCEMRGFGHSVIGTGEGIFLRAAAIKAFAESWERLWVMRICTADILPEYNINSSNGFAAGSTVVEAQIKSREELIERAALLKAWTKPNTWQQLRPAGLIAKTLAYCLERANWRTTFYEVKIVNSGSLVCGLLRNPNYGAIFDCIYKPETTTSFSNILARLSRSHENL